MKKNTFILVICLLCSGVVAAQQADFPRDTSFTLANSYEHIKKHYPDVKPVQPALPQGVKSQNDIVYRTLGNRALHLDVFYPAQKSQKVYPAVLLVHGGGWRSGNKRLEWPMAQQLAAHGYITVTAEYRLSLEAPYPAAVHDLKAALRWMRANAAAYKIDTTKIATYGTSAGGQLAALLGATNGVQKLEGQGDFLNYSSQVQAIVDIDGVLAMKHPESTEGIYAEQWLGGLSKDIPATWAEASALTYTGKNTPPIIYVGSSHPRFLAGKGDMIKILENEGIYHESHLLADSPHSFWLFEPWFTPTLQYTVNFLNKVFKGKPVVSKNKK